MDAPNNDPARAPDFPSWPFNWLSLYTHMAQDVGRYAQAVTKSTDPIETTRAEGDLGMRLWSDLMQGYYDLAMAPLTAMTSALAPPSETPPPPPQAKPARKARSAGPKA